MATFITLLNFTDQGIRNVKDSPERARAFQDQAHSLGVNIKDVYWTVGQYDLVTIIEAPDDETATAALLALGGKGNVRSHSLRAFNADEMRQLIDKIPE